MSSFASLDLHETLLKVLAESYGFTSPTAIEQKIIPLVRSENPLIFTSETGSGKTLAYILPILDKYIRSGEPITSSDDDPIKALFLAPTRILARQILEELSKFGVQANVFIGGEKTSNSSSIFAVATPGKALLAELHSLDYLVFDEGDRLMEMPDAIALLRKFKKSRLIVCSATAGRLREIGALFEIADGELRRSAQDLMFSRENQEITPLELQQEPGFAVPEALRIQLAPVLERDKIRYLFDLIQALGVESGKTVVFASTCAFARFITRTLRTRFPSEKVYNLSGKMHAKMEQNQLHQFKKSERAVLVTTDVAARGLDIDQIGDIIEFDLPKELETLVHRAGRTARAGRSGKCICICHVWEAQVCELLKNRGLIAEVVPPYGSDLKEIGKFSEGRKIQFLRTQLNKIKTIVERESTKQGSDGALIKYETEIKQLQAEILPLEAEEDLFNAGKLSAFDSETAIFMRKLNETSIEVQELASEAFISYIRGYEEHELKFICAFDQLDLGQLAMSMGLLSLPKMRETAGRIVFKGEHNALRAAEKDARILAEQLAKPDDSITQPIPTKEPNVSEVAAQIEPQQKPSAQKLSKFSRELNLLDQRRKGLLTDEDLEKLL